VPDEDVFALTAVERRRAADMFAGLSDEQFAVRSLCAEWTVRDVAGHLIGPFCVSVPRFMLGSLVSGGSSRYSVKRRGSWAVGLPGRSSPSCGSMPASGSCRRGLARWRR
jgi:Mycothiol maleylpyruvate isomerase N-terminal domain